MKRNTRILGCIFAAMVLAGAVTASAQEVEFNYNGRIKSGGLMFSGQGQFKFALVSKDGEATYWTNDGVTSSTAMPTATVEVTVTDGFFSVDIGDSSLPGMAVLTKDVFARDEDIYLRVWFNDSTRGFEMLRPDRKITNTDLLGLKISKNKDYTIHVNGATGNDKNLGLTPGKPKKTIQSAIDTLPAQIKCNVTIDIADGVYREQVNIIGINAMPGKKLTLLGDDSWTTVSVGDPSVRITGTDDDGITQGFARQNVIRGEQSSGFRLVGLYLDRSNGSRILLMSSSSWEVAQCKIRNTALVSNGLEVTSCGRGTFRDCVTTGNSIGLASIDSTVDVMRVSATGNFYGAYVTLSYLEITDCLFTSNTYDGLDITRSSNVEISGMCRFSNNGNSGLDISGSSGVVIHNPGEILNNGGYGLVVSLHALVIGYQYFTISGNVTANTYTATGGGLYRFWNL